jgi:hypothetical protein
MELSLGFTNIMRPNNVRSFVRRHCRINNSKKIILFSRIGSQSRKMEVRPGKTPNREAKECTRNGSNAKRKSRKSAERLMRRRTK